MFLNRKNGSDVDVEGELKGGEDREREGEGEEGGDLNLKREIRRERKLGQMLKPV